MFTNFKQVYFDEMTGKLLIFDESNNNCECNIYGEKLQKFLPNISGIATYKERKKNDQLFQFESDFDRTLYRPQPKKFEGYFQFPRPLSQPFFNEQFNKDRNEKILNLLVANQRFSIPKNKHLLELKSNQGMFYFTSSLSLTNENSKLKFISLIDKYIEDFKEENKYKLDLVVKSHKIKALKKLRNLMQINCGDKLIFGRTLQAPDRSFNDKNLINSNLFKKKLLEGNRNHFYSINHSFHNFNTRNVSNDKNNNTLFANTNNNSTLNVPHDDLSFLSKESEREIKKIKERSIIETAAEKEKTMLKGFKPSIIKPQGHIIKQIPRFLKTAGQLYYENLSVLKKVNPIAFQLEEKRNALYDEVLKKKKKSKLVGEKNFGF